MPAMNDSLSTLRLFVRIAHRGSFSVGARELNVPQPTASRTIAALERELGTALLVRTTRAVSLTDAGADFLARIEPILAALEEAEHAVRGTGELRGVLRVGLSSSFALREVVPRLPAFLARHPALRVDLLADDSRQNLVGEGVDVALRFGALTGASATARRISTWPRILAASPAYLAREGAPNAPEELARHAMIIGPAAQGGAWSFRKDGRETSVRVRGRVTVTLNEVATAAAVAGLGVASMTLGACRKELGDGSLIRLLPEWDMGTIELSAVFAAGRAAKSSARAFSKFLFAEFASAETA